MQHTWQNRNRIQKYRDRKSRETLPLIAVFASVFLSRTVDILTFLNLYQLPFCHIFSLSIFTFYSFYWTEVFKDIFLQLLPVRFFFCFQTNILSLTIYIFKFFRPTFYHLQYIFFKIRKQSPLLHFIWHFAPFSFKKSETVTICIWNFQLKDFVKLWNSRHLYFYPELLPFSLFSISRLSNSHEKI